MPKADVKTPLPFDASPSDGPTEFAGFTIQPLTLHENYLNILIYGISGVGKTVLSGSADAVEDMRPVLYLDIEGGTMSLRDFYPDVKVLRVPSWRDLQKVYNALYKGDHPYKTVVVDSLTEAQKFSMGDIMKAAVKEDPTIDPDIPRMRDWGKNINQMRRFVRGMRDLPINTIMTALAEQEKDNRGIEISRPLMNGKVAGEIPGFMDFVFYMYVKPKSESVRRMCLTQQTDNAMAKDRSNKLPVVIEDPTMGMIYSTIMGKATDS